VPRGVVNLVSGDGPERRAARIIKKVSGISLHGIDGGMRDDRGRPCAPASRIAAWRWGTEHHTTVMDDANLDFAVDGQSWRLRIVGPGCACASAWRPKVCARSCGAFVPARPSR